MGWQCYFNFRLIVVESAQLLEKVSGKALRMLRLIVLDNKKRLARVVFDSHVYVMQTEIIVRLVGYFTD